MSDMIKSKETIKGYIEAHDARGANTGRKSALSRAIFDSHLALWDAVNGIIESADVGEGGTVTINAKAWDTFQDAITPQSMKGGRTIPPMVIRKDDGD